MTDTAVINNAAPDPGGPAVSEARTFDFRYPSTLSREDARTLQLIQEGLAGGIATTLASAVRASIKVRIGDVAQVPYSDVLERMPNPTPMVLFRLEPVASTALVQLDPAFSYSIVELFLGGPGTGPHPERAHTEIEHALIAGWLQRLVPIIDEAFAPVAPVGAELIGQESNPTFVQFASPTDMVMTIGLEVDVDAQQSTIQLVVPVAAMRPHLDSVNAEPEDVSRESDEKRALRALVHDHLTSVDVSAIARFPRVRATSRQLADLAVGDVLMLDHGVDEPLLLDVAGVPIHEVSIGRIKRDVAVQILGPAPERPPRGRRLETVPGA